MRRISILLAALLVAVVAVPTSAEADAPASSAAASGRPHVVVIVLENKTFEETFGPDSPAPYLSRTLTAKGVLLSQYYGTGHLSLDNYVTMVSGQAPNPETQSDCQRYSDFVSPTGGALDSHGQVLGSGCVYPSTVLTVADQLEAAGLTWKGYMQDMGSPCRHPALGAQDDTQKAEVGDQYATRHNPFMYFHSVIDDPAGCAAHVVDLQQLKKDLRRDATTPQLSFITPDLCEDGHDAPCVDGRPGGLVSADAFLQAWVPGILSSPGFGHNGVLMVLFDESEATGPQADTRVCCNEQTGPNTLQPGITGPGGGRMGAVVISRSVRPGTVSEVPYNHYSLLRTLEDIFGLSHLGYAAEPGLQPFGTDVFSQRRQPAS